MYHSSSVSNELHVLNYLEALIHKAFVRMIAYIACVKHKCNFLVLHHSLVRIKHAI